MTYFAVAFCIVPLYALAWFLCMVFDEPTGDNCG
jgi:hypothetical protein